MAAGQYRPEGAGAGALTLAMRSAREHLYALFDTPTRRRLARGTSWAFLGTLCAQGMRFAANVAGARILGLEAFGEFGMVLSTLQTVLVFAAFGLTATATRFVAEFRYTDREEAGRIIALSMGVAWASGLLAALALVLGAQPLASGALDRPELATVLRIGALFLLFGPVVAAQEGALAGFEAFKQLAARNLIAGLTAFPLVAGGAYYGGVKGAIAGTAANALVSLMLNQYALVKAMRSNAVPWGFRDAARARYVLSSFSFPAFLSAASMYPSVWICNALLVNQAGGFEYMGVYSASMAFRNAIVMLAATIGTPLIAVLASRANQDNKRLETWSMVSTWSVGVFMAAPVLVFPDVIHLLYGQRFPVDSFSATLVLTMLSTTIIMYKDGLARSLLLYRKMWWGVWSSTLWSVLALGATVVLASYGAKGLASAILCAYALNTLLFIPFYHRKGLVPKRTLLSARALCIWGGVGILAVEGLFRVHWAIRLLTLVCAMLVFALMFFRLSVERISPSESA